MAQNSPFQQKYRKIKPKSRGDREYCDGRTYLQNKTELRQRVFERSEGKCEDLISMATEINLLHVAKNAVYALMRCGRPITWESMELSHKRHGIHRDDSERGVLASCKSCHEKRHAAAKIPRRPGKIMPTSKAKAYWEATECFCNGVKKAGSSFCPECAAKLSPQTAFTLENADDPESYREALAQAEVEILMYGK
jgi:hypothetical protein